MLDFVLVGQSARIALPLLQSLHSAKLGACALAGSQGTAGLRWSRLCREQVVINFADDDETVQRLNLLARRNPRAVLVPYDCEGMRLVIRLKTRLTLESVPLPDLQSLNMFDDKWRFYEFCRDSGLPVPATRLMASPADLDFASIASELGLPFIMKPSNASGSLGVRIVRSRAQFDAEIVGNPDYAFGSLIAQQFIDGVDMDINLLCIQGQLQAVSVHKPGAALIEFMPHAGLEDIAAELGRLSGYTGLMNVDVRIEQSSGRAYLIESNPRFWATLASTAYCGLNFAEEFVRPSEAGGEPKRLLAGRYWSRHPLLRPSCWGALLGDGSPKGRLLRAQAFDLYALGQLVAQVPAMMTRRLRRALSSEKSARLTRAKSKP
jgi:predicted ATP-grasp superfamily ATP-dependent carboligase